jgi:hypothetical protein
MRGVGPEPITSVSGFREFAKGEAVGMRDAMEHLDATWEGFAK